MSNNRLPLLVRGDHDSAVYVEHDDPKGFAISYEVRTRLRSQVRTPLGPMRMMEPGGPDRGRVRVYGKPMTGAVRVSLDREGVRPKVRRLRPQEAARLMELDREISELVERLDTARAARRAHLKESFRRGHAVTVKELAEAAEGRLRGGPA